MTMQPQLWGGLECTVNRVHDRYQDQVRATGHQDRAEDLDRLAMLGIRAIRYPVLWERVSPRHPDERDWQWTDERLGRLRDLDIRSEEHTSELQSLMRISYAVFCLKKKKNDSTIHNHTHK